MTQPWTLIGWILLLVLVVWGVGAVFLFIWTVRERQRALIEFEARREYRAAQAERERTGGRRGL